MDNDINRHIYKDHAFTDLTYPLDGNYRAMVVITNVRYARGLSQRFLELETFVNEADARRRAVTAAREWIDGAQRPDRLDLPSVFAPLP